MATLLPKVGFLPHGVLGGGPRDRTGKSKTRLPKQRGTNTNETNRVLSVRLVTNQGYNHSSLTSFSFSSSTYWKTSMIAVSDTDTIT